MVERYPEISDHGLIGDLQTAALVSTDGTVDWFCCPRFDSPSVFASLLDADKGGYFRICPDVGNYTTRQLYFPDTAILITRFLTPDGVGEVTDFMPIAGSRPTDRHRLARHIRVVRGSMRFVMDIKPRFDYGRLPHKLEINDDGAVFHADGLQLTMHSVGPRGASPEELGLTVERVGDDLRLLRTLHEGDRAGVVLESMGGKPRRIPTGACRPSTRAPPRPSRPRAGSAAGAGRRPPARRSAPAPPGWRRAVPPNAWSAPCRPRGTPRPRR